MGRDKKINLQEARKKGKLEQFIREHEKDAPGDLDKFEKAIKRSVRESAKATRKASSEESSDD